MTVLTKYWKGVALNSILWIYLGLIVLCYNEYSDSRPYKKYMDPFSLLFELVSAYGTIGYSLGYEICESFNTTNVNVLPGVYNGNATSAMPYVPGSAVAAGFEPGELCYGAPVSLAGAMKPLSKIVLMMTMLAGRHRGLPSHLYHKDMREGVKQQTKLVDLGV